MQELFCLWQHCPSESWVRRWCSCLACGDPGSAKCARTRTASATGVMALSESLFEPLVAGDQKASLASPSVALPIQALRGLPCLGFYSTDQALKGALGGVLLCSLMRQAFNGPASLLFSCQCWRVGGERLWWWLHPLRVIQQHCLASVAAWLSSTEISLHNLLPHVPSICLFAVNSNPRPGIRPYSPNSSSQGSLILIPSRLPHISCFTLSL